MPPQPKTIFVVDDEQALRECLSSELRQDGFRCYDFALKTNAFDKVLELQPDLIISDIKAPVMDGFQFLRYLKASPYTKKIPFIYLTGFADLQAAIEAMRLGAADFVSKPYDLDDLRQTIRRVISSEWTNSLYPSAVDKEHLIRNEEFKFLDWSTLKALFGRLLSNTHERTSIIAESNRWEIVFVADHRVGLMGGTFFRPLNIGAVTLEDILIFRRELDSVGVDMGIMTGLFASNASCNECAPLLGIHLVDETVVSRLLKNASQERMVPSMISLFSETRFDPASLRESRRFLPFMERISTEVDTHIGEEFLIGVPTAESQAKLETMSFRLDRYWDTGISFRCEQNKRYVYIPATTFWSAIMKIWKAGSVVIHHLSDNPTNVNCLLKLFERLPALRVADDKIFLGEIYSTN